MIFSSFLLVNSLMNMAPILLASVMTQLPTIALFLTGFNNLKNVLIPSSCIFILP